MVEEDGQLAGRGRHRFRLTNARAQAPVKGPKRGLRTADIDGRRPEQRGDAIRRAACARA